MLKPVINGDTEKGSVQAIEDAAVPGHVATKVDSPHTTVYIDPVLEAKLRRKFDMRILPTIALIYLFCFIDRANIGNARLAGLEEDLNMSGLDYSTLLASFYAAYTAFEFPLQMVNKWIGPGKTIPILTFFFGLFSFVMTFVETFGAAVAVRFLLGIAEGGVFPGLAFYLSRFYRKDELGFRLACYIVCAPLAGAFGGLLASGILKLDSIGPYTRWRMIFFVEGLVTMGIGIIAWFLIPDRPETAKWLTPEERALAEARLKADHVGQTRVVDQIGNKAVIDGVLNPSTLVLPTIIQTIFPDAGTIEVQLRSVPPYVVGAFTTLLSGYLSFKTRKRGLYMVISAPFMMIGYIMYLASIDPQVRYAASFMVALGAFSFGAFCNAWASANAPTDTARAASIGTVVAFGNCGGLVACFTYLPRHQPRGVPGNAFNLAGSTACLVLGAGLWAWQVKENRAKERGRDDYLLEGKTEDEIAALGRRNPAWRYAY
ncbi:hypothetical protein Rhopal_006592-T1 [Rhodotorula paludigena]|uniref:Major facilitator superfamily (MFS) profile domain-containing protein n=1 Tax=Rhodotorula paludigena TaxID=86838 RepID=A0AAV5GUF6_9BASI|nr:hypothetical protein Rhopal_006592-T1 [Rhodotorula paludigena]